MVLLMFQEFSEHKKTFPVWEGFHDCAILPHLLNCHGENDSKGGWFLVPGSWFLVLGAWFLVPGSWFLVLGSWFLV
ncbi:MAG TPA: hypothetical protein PKE58_10685, partial [Acidobacteriota bacterium]|nr:hypothetical protein [Acidobacteriota bacterium]